MIRFEKVSKSFGDREILKNLSFEVKKGEILFVIGQSGVGKSVTLKHIVGMLKPDHGRVYVDSDEVTAADELGLRRIRRTCGMVFQSPALFDSMSIYENVAFGLGTPQYEEAVGKKSTSEKRKIVLDKLRLVNLEESILPRYPSEISFGMQKRVSLARTIAPEPNYLLFDEPTTGLDPITTQAINRLIQDLSRELKVTSIVVSHDMGCALGIADRILVLDQGGILALDTPAKIRRSKERLIQDFLAEVEEVGEA